MTSGRTWHSSSYVLEERVEHGEPPMARQEVLERLGLVGLTEDEAELVVECAAMASLLVVSDGCVMPRERRRRTG